MSSAVGAVDPLLNPNQAGVNSARLFGFEADYSNSPNFLRETGFGICTAKIEGYLDGDKVSDGAVSSYSCNPEVLSKFGRCELRIDVDLRAQRTQINPDGTTSISYSFYVRGTGEPLKMILALSYVYDGQDRKDLFFEDLIEIGAEETYKSQRNVHDFKFNSTLDLDKISDEDLSMRLNLLVINDAQDKIFEKSVFIPLITAGDYYQDLSIENIGEGGSNPEDSDATSGAEAKPITSNDMLDMIN